MYRNIVQCYIPNVSVLWHGQGAFIFILRRKWHSNIWWKRNTGPKGMRITGPALQFPRTVSIHGISLKKKSLKSCSYQKRLKQCNDHTVIYRRSNYKSSVYYQFAELDICDCSCIFQVRRKPEEKVVYTMSFFFCCFIFFFNSTKWFIHTIYDGI